MEQVRQDIATLKNDSKHMREDIKEIKKGVQVFGVQVVSHEVQLTELNRVRKREDKRDEKLQEIGEALSRLEWIPNTVKGIIASLVALGIWIIKGLISSK